jgi:hypothetical protein
VADETGDVKKGTATPGVQRQYTGTRSDVTPPWVMPWNGGAVRLKGRISPAAREIADAGG